MRSVVGIFAHPDDEAFGPSGTLAILAKERDVYLVCVTNGDAGENKSSKGGSLAQIRREEMGESAKVLGVKEVFFLDYKDGELSNNLYHEIADKIKNILDKIEPEILLTFEPRGLSGHIDHIAISMITSFVFEKSPHISELWQFCLSVEGRKMFGDYFIYCPPGYTKEEISKEVDVSGVWDIKVASMHEHQSQKKDMERALEESKTLPKVESFIIKKRE